MALKATASSPISSVRWAYSVNRVSTSPWANLWAARLMPFRGSVIRWTATEQITRERSITATAVMRKSWKISCMKFSREEASAARKRMPMALPLVMFSPVMGSTV